MNNVKILMIAGEASGDNLGAKLIKSLKSYYNNIEFYGIGGDQMKIYGFNSIFPMKDLSVVGFVEVITKLPKIFFRLWQTVRYIKSIKPDLIITIDSPGFNFLIAKKIKNIGVKLVHYVAPTVWAYRAERAKKIAKLYDYLLVILPFEQPYFTKEGLKTFYIGHPIIEDYQLYNIPKNLKYDTKSILIMPGSRVQEIKILLPIFLKSAVILKEKFKKLDLYIITLKHLKPLVEQIITDHNYDLNFTVSTNNKDKPEIFSKVDAAIVKSGTASLEVAMAKIPMIVAYKINKISAFIFSKLLKIRYINLINIISNQGIISELLQDECTPENITFELLKVISNDQFRNRQIENSYQVLQQIGLKQAIKPSDKAAKIILNEILDLSSNGFRF